MVRRVFIISLSIVMLSFTALALAGGPPVVAAPYAAPCGPYPVKPYAAGPACAYWGDAPFPGLCGGIVALPFLVVGSLLGGNTMGPYGGPPVAAQCAPRPYPAKDMRSRAMCSAAMRTAAMRTDGLRIRRRRQHI